MPDIDLDELDFQIINALQIDPRVRWSALADILQVDAHTLSRRWQRIETGGAAWLSALTGVAQVRAIALLEIDSRPGQVLRSADAIAALPLVASIELATGACDLFVTLFARDEDELAHYLLERVGSIPEVAGMRAHLLSKIARVGSDWHLNVLSSAQIARIPQVRRPRPGSAKLIHPELADSIRAALQEDVRMPYGELGEKVGISSQRAADTVARLRHEGHLQLRADMSERFTLYPAVNWLFLQLPAARVEGAMEKIRSMQHVQFAAVSTGPANVILAITAKDRAGLLATEISVIEMMPEAEVKDRMTMLRLYKHLGREVNGFEKGAGRRGAPLLRRNSDEH